MGIDTPRLAPGLVSFPTTNASTPVGQGNVQNAASPGSTDQFVMQNAQPSPLDQPSGVSSARGVFGGVPDIFVEDMVKQVNKAYECGTVNDYFYEVEAVAKQVAAGSVIALRVLDEIIGNFVEVVYTNGFGKVFLDRQEACRPDELKLAEERGPSADAGSDLADLEKRLVRRARSLDHLWVLYQGIARKAFSKDGNLHAQREYWLLEYLSYIEKDLIATSVFNVVAPMRKGDEDRRLKDVSAFRTEYVRLGKNVASLINDLDVDATVQMMIDDPQIWVYQMDALRFAGGSSTPLWGIQELAHVLKLYAELKKDRSFEFGVRMLADKAMLMNNRRMFDYFMALAVRDDIARNMHYRWFLENHGSDQCMNYRSESLKRLAGEGDPIAAARYADLEALSSTG